MFPQITQGAVLINSFDPAIGAGNYDIEMVVLVNRTSSNIDLNGYEILCYNFNAIPHTPAFWQFTASYILPPYRFLLITRNTNNVSGVSADLVRIQYGGQIDYDGYLAFKKINATNPSDFVDIVKYSQYAYPSPNPLYQFTAVPANSGIDMSMPGVAFDTGPNQSYLTRGGISGNINSLIYTGYGMVGQTVSDFFEVPETNAAYVEHLGSPPLPVELSGFSASVLSEKEVMLNWTTETEVSNYGFEIQRRTFGDIEWTRIGFVAGHGNSNSPKHYSFTDGNPINGSKFNYRLKQIDTDGQFEYSDLVEVEIVPTKFELSQNYPNPFNPSTVIEFSLPEDVSNVKLSVYNELGEKVADLVNNSLPAGEYQYTWNAENTATGMYIYELRTDKFVSVKKMILLR